MKRKFMAMLLSVCLLAALPASAAAESEEQTPEEPVSGFEESAPSSAAEEKEDIISAEGEIILQDGIPEDVGTEQDAGYEPQEGEDPTEEPGDPPAEAGPEEKGASAETALEDDTAESDGQEEGLSSETLSGTESTGEDDALKASSAEGGENEPYDSSFITGFAELEISWITALKKPALCAVLEQLPEEIVVCLGGTPSADPAELPADAELQSIPVAWECLQDYDEWLTDYEFVPVPEGFRLAEGIELPVVLLTVEDLSMPAGGHDLTGERDELPIVGSGLRRSAESSYNGYELGNLPPLRNQGQYGTCWAFSAVGAVEADLIADGWASPEAVDLAELHLAYFTYHNYFDPKGLNAGDTFFCDGYLSKGGNSTRAYHTLANMVGPADESDAPYDAVASYAPAGTEAKSMSMAQLTGVSMINPEDREAAKSAILQHGAVGASMYISQVYYSAKNNSYYYAGGAKPNHDILLVGWDDAFPADSFPAQLPPGDGAWLVRNSYGGEGYGYAGYFWISYYDEGLLCDVFTAFDAEPLLFDHVYAYDTAVGRSGHYYTLPAGTKVIQHFTADADEAVEAVGLDIDADTDLSVVISDGTHTAVGSFSGLYRGFCLIRLDSPLLIARQTDLTVTVTWNKTGKLFYEKPGSDDIYTASCGSGGFIIQQPGGHRQNVDADAGIKLYSNDCTIPTYIVTYVAEGAENVPEAQTKTYGVALKLSETVPTKEGQFFEGWVDEAGKLYQPGDEYTTDAALTLTATWSGPVEAFVTRAYRLIQGREPDVDGLIYWSESLKSGERTAAQIVSEFVNSKEYLAKGVSSAEFVTTMYKVMQNREPDAGGLAYWVDILDSPCSYNCIVNGFASSDEFKGICAEYGIEAGSVPMEARDLKPNLTKFLTRNYRYALVREPEVEGLNWWALEILNGNRTPKDAAVFFVFSDECVARDLNNSDFVEMLYGLFMGRASDAEGKTYWVNQLTTGKSSRNDVVDFFAGSQEFADIVASFGL